MPPSCHPNQPTQRANAAAGKDRKAQYDLGLIMRPCEPPFQRTSLLTLVPRYLLINRLDAPLEFSQAGCAELWTGILRPGEEAPFYWPWADRKKCIQARIASSDKGAWQWSCDLPVDSVGELHLKLRTAGDNPHKRIAILQVRNSNPPWYTHSTCTAHLSNTRHPPNHDAHNR